MYRIINLDRSSCRSPAVGSTAIFKRHVSCVRAMRSAHEPAACQAIPQTCSSSPTHPHAWGVGHAGKDSAGSRIATHDAGEACSDFLHLCRRTRSSIPSSETPDGSTRCCSMTWGSGTPTRTCCTTRAATTRCRCCRATRTTGAGSRTWLPPSPPSGDPSCGAQLRAVSWQTPSGLLVFRCQFHVGESIIQMDIHWTPSQIQCR